MYQTTEKLTWLGPPSSSKQRFQSSVLSPWRASPFLTIHSAILRSRRSNLHLKNEFLVGGNGWGEFPGRLWLYSPNIYHIYMICISHSCIYIYFQDFGEEFHSYTSKQAPWCFLLSCYPLYDTNVGRKGYTNGPSMSWPGPNLHTKFLKHFNKHTWYGLKKSSIHGNLRLPPPQCHLHYQQLLRSYQGTINNHHCPLLCPSLIPH